MRRDLSFAETCIKDILDNIMPSRYLSKQSRFSYVRYMKLGQPNTNNTDILRLLESLNGGREDSKELRISHLMKEGLHATSGCFVFLQREAADANISNYMESPIIHAPRFCLFDEHLLQNLYHL